MTLAFVQFPHPGVEHRPAGDEMAWNRGDHGRKFLRASGTYLAGGELREGAFSLWGEWEAQSRVIRRFQDTSHGMPHCLQEPYWCEPGDGGWRQNTDPLVFGDRFLYSCCRQQRNATLRDLAPGSVVLFGSSLRGEFVLDTVFVVGDRVQTFDPRHVIVDVPEWVRKLVFEPLAMDDPPAELPYTLYAGRMQADVPGGAFCFAPCVLGESTRSAFPRPVIRLEEKWLSPKLAMAAKATPASPGDVDGLWREVVRQVEAAGLALAVRLDVPPHRIDTSDKRDPASSRGCSAPRSRC